MFFEGLGYVSDFQTNKLAEYEMVFCDIRAVEFTNQKILEYKH